MVCVVSIVDEVRVCECMCERVMVGVYVTVWVCATLCGRVYVTACVPRVRVCLYERVGV